MCSLNFKLTREEERNSCFWKISLREQVPLGKSNAWEYGASRWGQLWANQSPSSLGAAIPDQSLRLQTVTTTGSFHNGLTWVTWFPSWFVFQEEIRSKSKVCANVFCGAGRECAVTEKGEPTCLCIEVGPDVRDQWTAAKASPRTWLVISSSLWKCSLSLWKM